MLEHLTVADVLILITAITTMITSIIAAIRATSANDTAKANGVAVQAVQTSVNGHTDKLVASAAADAYKQGHAAGFAEALPLQVTPKEV